MRPFLVVVPLVLAAVLLPDRAPAVLSEDAESCAALMDKAAGKFAQCNLKAQAAFTKDADTTRLLAALTTCGTKLSDAFEKATAKFPGDCPATEDAVAFNDYLSQCSEDVAAAAVGATLPDYVTALAACNEERETCDIELADCQSNPPIVASSSGIVADFGNVPVGTTRTKAIPIKLASGEYVGAASGITALNPPYDFDFAGCNGVIGPATCAVIETFTPSAASTTSGPLFVYIDPSFTAVTINLTGTGF